MNYIHPFIRVKESLNKGLGIFSIQRIDAGDLIEVSPVIVLSQQDTKLIHQTKLHDYYFTWDDSQDKSAIALGYISLYNHSKFNNCYHECDFEKNTVSIYAKHDINKEEELFISYTLGEEKNLWFSEQ